MSLNEWIAKNKKITEYHEQPECLNQKFFYSTHNLRMNTRLHLLKLHQWELIKLKINWMRITDRFLRVGILKMAQARSFPD